MLHMRTMKLELFLLLLGLLDREVLTEITCEGQRDLGEIRLTWPRQSKYDGAIEMCISYSNQNNENVYTWTPVFGGNGWDNHAASVACRELSLSFSGGTADRYDGNRVYTITNQIDCTGNEYQLRDCLSDGFQFRKQTNIATVTCHCTNEAMRLVSGPSNREGRVEVCVDGRWGTVCGEGWGDTEAGLVCASLGFPREGAMIIHDSQGTLQSIYNLTCSSPESDPPNCTTTPAPD